MMMRNVTGIGGFFFRANDPRAIALWYRDHLGIDLSPSDYETEPWSQDAGPTVFAPFPADKEPRSGGSTKYTEAKGGKGWMLNLRVRDLDGLVKELRGRGVDVTVDPEVYPNGRFAKLKDPEGNPLELWEPGGVAVKRA